MVPIPFAAVALRPGRPAFGEWWERPTASGLVVEVFHVVFAKDLLQLRRDVAVVGVAVVLECVIE